MQQDESVTFGAGLLERAAHLRADPQRLRAMLAAAGPAVLPFWHGKVLLGSGAPAVPVLLEPAHPALTHAREPPLFLGCSDGRPVFAADISAWEPPAGSVPRDRTAFLDTSRQPLPGSGGSFGELRAVMAELSPAEAEIVATARAMLAWHATHRYCAACGAEALPAMGGWQRDCPACGARHFPRTDPVVIMLVTHGNSVLLGRSQGWPERMYSALAGFVEPGESIEAAVRREVAEEVGVPVGPVRYLASQPWPYPSSLMIGCHGTALARALSPDPAEIADARWLSREEAARALAGRHPEIAPPRQGAIAAFLLRNWLADRLE